MTTTIKPGEGVSRYLRLYRVLSQALAERHYRSGQPMPSEPRLMRDYGVSRSTVRRALARLEAEGRIERIRGSGTFARDRGDPAAAPGDLTAVLDGEAGSPGAATRRTIAFQRVATPAFLLAESPAFGATALLIRRVHQVGREPVMLETAHLPQEVGSGLTRQQLGVDGGVLLTVLAAGGHRSASLEREFAALGADPLAANSLGIAVGAPVFSVRTLARDALHRSVAHITCLYRPDRYEAHATIRISRPKS